MAGRRFGSASRSHPVLSFLALAATATLAPILSLPASAQLKTYPFSGQAQWGGSPGHLPFGPGVSEESLIQHAYTMPAVQELLAVAAQRGYLSHPEANRGRIQQMPPVSMVILPFERPGAWLPDGYEGTPVLLVASADHYGQPRTTMSLTFILFDTETGEARTADSYPEMGSDHTVERSGESRAGGGGREDFRVAPEHVDPEQFSNCAQRYYGCSGTSLAQCVLSAVPFGNVWVAAAVVTLCYARMAHECLHDFASCLDH